MSPADSVSFLQSRSDQTLVGLASHGYERAFEALVRRYRKELVSHCLRMRLSPAAAEDAVQQGLLQAYMALRRGGDVREARAWLHRIVHNVALAAARSGPDHAPLRETLDNGRTLDAELELRSDVRDALARVVALPEPQRSALLGHAADGLSHAQLAARLGLSPTAIRGLIYRARATLRTAATALTPTWMLRWAVGRGRHVGVGLRGGGASAGLAGLMAKGGVATVTTAALSVAVGLHLERTERIRLGQDVDPAAILAVGAPAPERGVGAVRFTADWAPQRASVAGAREPRATLGPGGSRSHTAAPAWPSSPVAGRGGSARDSADDVSGTGETGTGVGSSGTSSGSGGTDSGSSATSSASDPAGTSESSSDDGSSSGPGRTGIGSGATTGTGAAGTSSATSSGAGDAGTGSSPTGGTGQAPADGSSLPTIGGDTAPADHPSAGG